MAQAAKEEKKLVLASETLAEYLSKRKGEIERVIPRHLNPDRLLRIAISAVARKNELQIATIPSLLRSIMAATILGLELDVNGEAYLVPFKNGKTGKYEAQLIVGYRGFIKLARQSREVESIHAGIVLPGDSFDYEEGDQAFVKHKRALRPISQLVEDTGKEEDRKDPNHLAVAWYCATRMRGARYPQVRVADPYEVEATRRRSRARDSGPWVTDYDAMGLKTVIRRAARHWPASPNLSRATEIEDRQERALSIEAAPMLDIFPEAEGVIDVTPEPADAPQEKGTVDALAGKLAKGPDPKKGKDEPGADG